MTKENRIESINDRIIFIWFVFPGIKITVIINFNVGRQIPSKPRI